MVKLYEAVCCSYRPVITMLFFSFLQQCYCSYLLSLSMVYGEVEMDQMMTNSDT